MNKRLTSIVILLCLVLALLGGTVLCVQQRQLSDKLIRLHVVGRSDSDHDQAVKLQVRDAVLEVVGPMLEGTSDARTMLAENLPAIRNAASRTLLALGENGEVTVSLGHELFPTRDYDSFSLPAGVYESLRVTIGPGEGRNWWCVVFPSLCLTTSVDELEQAAQAAGLSDGEIRLITGESPGFVLKFKIVELLQRCKNALFDR